jgi:ribonuclease HI
VVLRKPGKPAYDTPKAYRPIALLNTIGKLLTAIVTEDLMYMTEKHHLLPANHFGGRPGRMTTDSLHLITNRIKGAWHRKKVATILFLDIEGAFPNAATDRLLHNMRKRRVPEEYVQFVGRMLAERRTRLSFDDFISDWVPIDNGIGQGDPISMILYLYYNADLVDVASAKGQSAVAFVDDANLYAEGNTYEEAYKSLSDMLLKPGGAKEWTQTHHSKFEKTKLAIVCFSRRRMPDPTQPGKSKPETHPNFIYEDVSIQPQGSHKFLGVIFDEELRWRAQAEKAVAKAAKWTLLFRRLTRPSTGVRMGLMRQLYCAVAIPKFSYAADVWYTPIHRPEGKKKARGSVSVVRKLTSLQRIATIAITGAMRTTATDTLEVHANIMPVELLLLNVCYRAALRMASLPESHPLHKPVRSCARRLVKRHPSPLHTLYHVFSINPNTQETVTPASHAPDTPPRFTTNIADSREESKADNVADKADVKVYADGSGIDGNVGAAAVLYKNGKRTRSLKYQLGTLKEHTTYEAEAVGVTLALELIAHERGIATATILLDNQAVIQSLSHVRAKPAQHIISEAHDMANRMVASTRRRRINLNIAWISGHDDVEGNEEADKEAKKAAAGEGNQMSQLPAYLSQTTLPRSITAMRQAFGSELHQMWRNRWITSPRYTRMAQIDDKLPSKKFHKTLAGLTRAQSSLLIQLRTAHIPLNKHLHRIKRSPTPVCPACNRADETVHHFLFDCRAHEHARSRLRHTLGRKSKSLTDLLGTPESMKTLMEYVARTERLKATFGDVSPPMN